MKKLAESPWMQRPVYFATGLALALWCYFIQFKWMDMVPNVSNELPWWLKALKWQVGWLPWVALAIVVVLRIVLGRRVRAGSYFLGTIAPPFLLISWFLFGDVFDEWMHLRTFDAVAWRVQESTEQDSMWPPRLCMVDDLMASRRLIGMTKTQVVELLGPPEPEGFPFGANASDIHYYLGPDRGFIRIDSEWLLLKFGEDGRLNHQWLYRD